MNPRDGVRLAFAQIRAQKLKSFFAIIGVLIGAMFLVTVVSMVEGINRYIEEDFAATVYGLNTITVRRTPSVNFNTSAEQWREWQSRPRLTFADAAAIRERLAVPATVATASTEWGGRVSARGTTVEEVRITGASAGFFRIRNYAVARGRAYSPPEARRGTPVVVLGSGTADALFGTLDPLGRVVRIGGFPFRVIGVLEEQGSLFGMSLDNQAIAPAHSPVADVVSPRGFVESILVRTDDAAAIERAKVRLTGTMRTRHQLRPGESNDFAVETAEASLAFWDQISRILFIAFPGLVAISLVVGALVITNIMLVSVAERTSEIGLRKALGARRRDILLQLLIESGTLSGLGALLGIGLGVLGALAVRALSPLPAAIVPLWIAVAALLGVGVGVVAGVYPATRAARLDPVVALRQE